MLSKFQIFTLSIQFLTVLISIFFYKKFRSGFMTILLSLLIISVLVEFIGAYFLITKNKGSFYVFYLHSFFEFNLITLLFYRLLKTGNATVLILGAIFNIYYLISLFNPQSAFYNLIILGSINVGIYSFLFLRELLNSNKILNYSKLLPFWVAVGFLVFYVPTIPFFVMIKHMSDRGLFFLLDIFIIIMNFFICYGLVCSNKEMKY